ncbi:phage-related protein (TIGR01555 family) [Lactobacillus colini]|uniref:Phage-related protein (TIGR01555 family) n=1 Tax=Lactobacillus colini TaxID=1819254 RepID=A0ABS4MDX1_9LACO|nr:anti-CBASS Acb1 family protein [Lactobacillus colini]MBP2057885.1 phage-related protein (TIGR01555 family) [Lactobacillus colini]
MGLFDVFKPKKEFKVDFMDYDSRGRTFAKFGSIRPQPFHGQEMDYDTLDNLYKRNGIAHTIVAKPAQDATRNGWRLIIPDNPTKQAEYQKALDALDLKKVLAQEVIYQRKHGDGYITFGVKENIPTSLNQPLDPQNIRSISFIHAFGENHVRKNLTNDDPTGEDYGKESAVVLDPHQSGDEIDNQGNVIPKTTVLKPVVIDSSRYFHLSLDKMEDDWHGTSVLEKCLDPLKTLDTALYSTGKILYEYTLKVLNSRSMAEENAADFERDKTKLEQGMSTESVVVLNDVDRLSKLSTQTSGISELYNFAWQNICTSAEIPKSVLTGEQAGTLAGASQDVVNYYDSIKAFQEEYLRPQIEYIIKLLMWASDVAGGSEDPEKLHWKLEFNPLYSPDDKTQSETLVNYANAAATLVNAGIKAPDEAAKLIDGQDNNQISGMQATKEDSLDISDSDVERFKSDIIKKIEKFKK